MTTTHKTDVTVTLSMTGAEAEWLRNYMQTYKEDRTEPAPVREMKKRFHDALDTELNLIRL